MSCGWQIWNTLNTTKTTFVNRTENENFLLKILIFLYTFSSLLGSVTATTSPPLGGHEYTLPEYLRGGGGAPSPSLLSDIYLEWGVQKNSDFGIEPYDLNETLCVGRSQNYKNFFLLAKHGCNTVSEVMSKWSVFSPIIGMFTPRYNQPVDTIGWNFCMRGINEEKCLHVKNH